MNKIIVTKDANGSEEHPGKSFKEVIKQFEGKKVNVFLEKYIPGPDNIGSIFYKSVLIGNTSQNLDYVDYWNAYDKLI